MKVAAACLIALACFAVGCAHPKPALSREADQHLIKRVLIISIDGLRPDLLVRARTPHIKSLLESSSYSLWALTVDDPYVYTLPAHVSMLTGVSPDRHGVTWNDYIEHSYPQTPTLFEMAKRAGLTTGLVSGKMKFIVFTKPGALDWFYLPPDEPVDDVDVVSRRAVRMLREHRPDVMFVHLPGVDTAGHASGWGSPEQLTAVERADVAVGAVLTELRRLNLENSTLLIVTADHGGAGLKHGGIDPRSRTIPWIVRGPGVRKGFDLTRIPQLTIRTEDTFATACALLGIALPAGIDGHFVEAVLADGQLMHNDR